MATVNRRRRTQDGSSVGNTVNANNDENRMEGGYENDEWWRAAVERRGWCSLALAVLGPASLHLLDVFFLRSTYKASAEPWYATRAWMVDCHFLISSVLISLCSWFTWAENNGFRRNPMTVVALYTGCVVLGVAWGPVVIGLGSVKAGVLVTTARAGIVLAIGAMLKELNHRAGNTVMLAGGLSSIYIIGYIRQL